MNLINYRMCGVEPLNITSQINKVKNADLGKLSGILSIVQSVIQMEHLNTQKISRWLLV